MKVNLLILTVFLICSSELIFGQSSDGTCGAKGKNQNCGSVCCSQFGFCGSTADYCGSGCQSSFGKCGAAANTTTTTVTKPKVSAITKCTVPGTVAITFDDGPSQFTHSLLDSLKALKAQATFFINGNNFGCIYDNADVLIRAKNEGHQIAHHTWSHPDLATLNKAQITYQVQKLEVAFTKILGVIPKFLRPPFGSGVDSDLVMSTLTGLGYTVVTWDTDTNDWQGTTTAQSLSVYNKASPPPASHIVLNHDTVKNTALTMGPQAIKLMQSRKFKINTVGQCLGITDPSKWYKTVGAPQKRDKTWVCTPSDINGP